MVDRFCDFLTQKIRKEMPEVDDERAEIINYGVHLIVGELPKFLILFIIGFLLGIGELTILSLIVILPYRAFSGGFHLKTHLGCIVCTSLMYCGNAFIAKNLVIDSAIIKYIIIALVWCFGMIMIKLYAPADTENVPILRKKERNLKRNLSYIILTISLLIAVFIKNNVISNLIIFGMLIQSIFITKIAYKITNNRYGYEIYNSKSIV